MQEVGVGIRGGAENKDVVSPRAHLVYSPGLLPPHLHVVKGEVEGIGIGDQAVVGHHRDPRRPRFLHRRQDGVLVPSEDDEAFTPRAMRLSMSFSCFSAEL